MKYFIGLLFIILSFNSFSQTKKNHPEVNRIIKQLDKKMVAFDKQYKKLVKYNKKLEKQLEHYRAKEDYFAAALDEQATRFSTIIAFIIAALGFVSWGWWRIEFRALNDRIKGVSKDFYKLNRDTSNLHNELVNVRGSANAAISDILRSGDNFIEAFGYAILAARDFYLSSKKESNPYYGTIIQNLKEALVDFNKAKERVDKQSELLENVKVILSDLDILEESSNNDVKVLCAKLRIQFDEFDKAI